MVISVFSCTQPATPLHNIPVLNAQMAQHKFLTKPLWAHHGLHSGVPVSHFRFWSGFLLSGILPPTLCHRHLQNNLSKNWPNHSLWIQTKRGFSITLKTSWDMTYQLLCIMQQGVLSWWPTTQQYPLILSPEWHEDQSTTCVCSTFIMLSHAPTSTFLRIPLREEHQI